MSILKNPFYQAEQAKKEYEAYKASHTSPFLQAAKISGMLLVLGLAMNLTGFLFTLTIIGAVIGIPLILLGTAIFTSSIALYPIALTALLISHYKRLQQKAHNTNK